MRLYTAIAERPIEHSASLIYEVLNRNNWMLLNATRLIQNQADVEVRAASTC